MAEAPREAWITGIGIVSCLGEGLDAHWQGFADKTRVIDAESFPPFIVHPLAPIDFDKQIPKRGDQRQMEPWQRIGTYAAGLALDSAGAKGNTALLGRMDMIVAAGGGERDEAVDAAIMSELPKAAKPDQFRPQQRNAQQHSQIANDGKRGGGQREPGAVERKQSPGGQFE